MAIRIIAIGKKHEPWLVDGIARYQKRLKKPYDIEWVLLPHSERDGDAARIEESERIQARLKSSDYAILLDERGHIIDSVKLSQTLESALNHQSVTIIIGGAYGVTPELTAQASFVWSLSKLVFPHQLVRLLLVEQIYRSQEIAVGKPYHHI